MKVKHRLKSYLFIVTHYSAFLVVFILSTPHYHLFTRSIVNGILIRLWCHEAGLLVILHFAGNSQTNENATAETRRILMECSSSRIQNRSRDFRCKYLESSGVDWTRKICRRAVITQIKISWVCQVDAITYISLKKETCYFAQMQKLYVCML